MQQGFPGINEVFGGRYRVLSQLGEGGMGRVYRALDQERNEPVALKIVHSDLTMAAQVAQRFGREIKVLRRLEHPNIVSIYDDGNDKGFFYFTMELVAGPTLASFVDPVDPLPLDQVLLLFGQVCSAIHHAHSRGVIHRDLKPTNIIIQDGKRAKLLDFGLAHLKDDAAMTFPGQALGTASYMAPEVGRGEAAGPAADIYALGCLFFQLATGLLPFQGQSSTHIIRSHQREEPPRVRHFRPDATANMEDAVLRALHKDPASRFENALSFFEKLARPDSSQVTTKNFRSPFSIHDFPSLVESTTPRWIVSHTEDIPDVGILGGWEVALSPDGNYLAVGADGIKGPLLYRVRNREWASMGDHGAGRNVRALCWSRSGRVLAFTNSSRLVLVDMSRNRTLGRLDVSNHRPWAVALIPTPSGKPKAATCGESGGVIVWAEWPDGPPEVFRAHGRVARDIKLSATGQFFITVGLDGCINLWRSSNCEPLRTVCQDDSAIWSLAHSRTGQYIATASSNRKDAVQLYLTVNRRLERQDLLFTGRAVSVAFSVSERVLAVGGKNRIYFVERGEGERWEVREEVGVEGEVRSLSFDQADRTVYALTSHGTLLSLRRGSTTKRQSISTSLIQSAIETSDPFATEA